MSIILCKNIFCVFWDNGFCKRKEIRHDLYGLCETSLLKGIGEIDTTKETMGQKTSPSSANKQASRSAAPIKQHKNVFGKRRSLRAMPFLRFAGHSAKTQGVFPQGHRKYQSAVPYIPLTCPACEHIPPLPYRLRR